MTIGDLDRTGFGELVAEIWRRQGWETTVNERSGDVFVAARRQEPPAEGLILTKAGGDTTVPGREIQEFLRLCEENDIGESAVVTAGTFTDDAEQVAEGYEVDILDGDRLEAFVSRAGLTDLVERYAGGGDDDADTDDAAGPSLLDRVPDLDVPVSPPAASVPDDAGRLVVALLVIAGVVAAGVVVGPTLLSLLPFAGGGGSDTVQAVSAAPPDSATTLHVEWNAERRTVIDPNGSDDRAYYPPENETFLVVSMVVTNAGNGSVPLRQGAFRLETNATRYGYQPLEGVDGFIDFSLAPNQTYSGWTVFSVPEGAEPRLVYDQGIAGRNASVNFTRNPDLAINVST